MIIYPSSSIKIDSLATRFENVQFFLIENFFESKTCVFRLLKILYITLINAIARDANENKSTIVKHEDQNKILKIHQIEIFHEFIRSLLLYDIQFIKFVVLNVIKHLKRSQNFDFDDSISRWFRAWWQTIKLHTIRIKSLAVIQYSTAQIKDVRKWFHEYHLILKKLQIKNKRNILNFDEIRFRIDCMEDHDIIMFEKQPSFLFWSCKIMRWWSIDFLSICLTASKFCFLSMISHLIKLLQYFCNIISISRMQN